MLHKDNCKPIQEAFECLDLMRLILEILWYSEQREITAVTHFKLTKNTQIFILESFPYAILNYFFV